MNERLQQKRDQWFKAPIEESKVVEPQPEKAEVKAKPSRSGKKKEK